jgi:hypothetical protein
MMKKVTIFLALLAAGLMSVTPVMAEDNFYVIGAGRPEVGAKITSLPFPINTPGYYFLTGNLSYSGGNAITVNCDNVTIDLMGFRLAGPSNNNYIGIQINGGNNVEVRNGTLAGWYEGVWGSGGSRHRMINVRANGNTYGFYLNGDDHLVEKCTAIQGSFGTGAGIVLNSTGKVSDCTVINFSSYGIFISKNGIATGNMVLNCSDTGIYAYSGTALVSYNLVGLCRYGIASGGAGGSIIGNVVTTITGGMGILPSVYLDRPNVLDQNTVSGSDTHYGGGTAATVWGLNAGR